MIRPKLLIHTVLEKERERTTTDSKRLIGVHVGQPLGHGAA